MKKIVLLIISILIIIPFRAKAASIENVTAYAPSYEINVGEKFGVSYTAKFDISNKENFNTAGIFMVLYELEFDDNILEPLNINSSGFDNYLYQEDGKYYVLSIVNESNKTKCSDNFLSCSNYKSELTFQPLKAESATTTVKMTSISAILFKVDETGESYTEENMIEVEYNTPLIKTINLNVSDVTSSKKSQLVTENKPEITENLISDSFKNSEKENYTDLSKSSNNLLTSLTIKDYDINFSQDRYTYKLYVPNDVNTLQVNAEPADEKATYTITGADDLKENNDHIKIVVKAENGEEITYTIIIERNKEKISKDPIATSITNKLNRVAIIATATIMIIIIICIYVNISNKRKLNELLEKELRK